MPIYEYACKACGHSFDALQKMSEEPLVECPECGKPELKKLVSAPNFRLKGSGWYETDFKKDNRRNIVEGSDKKATDTSESATDSKPKDGAGQSKDPKSSDGKASGDKASGGSKPASGKSGRL